VALVDLPGALRPVPAGVGPADALRERRVIKRVAASAGERTPRPVAAADPVVPPGHLVLLGDNPDGSGDSRQYGFVPAAAVVGVVVRPLAAGG
jgi:signal peptidase I